jgi:hypothetical protein
VCLQVFERLKEKVDPAEQRKQHDELNARRFVQEQKSQERLVELVRESIGGLVLKLTQWQIDDNTTQPVTISSIRVLNANRTRRAFLERIVDPLLSANRNEPYTLAETLQQIGGAVDKLNRFGEQARDLAQPKISNHHQASSSLLYPSSTINQIRPSSLLLPPISTSTFRPKSVATTPSKPEQKQGPQKPMPTSTPSFAISSVAPRPSVLMDQKELVHGLLTPSPLTRPSSVTPTSSSRSMASLVQR